MMKNQEDFQDVQDFNGPGEFLFKSDISSGGEG